MFWWTFMLQLITKLRDISLWNMWWLWLTGLLNVLIWTGQSKQKCLKRLISFFLVRPAFYHLNMVEIVDTSLWSVVAKYVGHAGHVRQTAADVRQRDQTLPDILSSRVQYTWNVWQGKQKWPMIFASHQLGKMSDSGSKCPAERWRPAGHFVQHT